MVGFNNLTSTIRIELEGASKALGDLKMLGGKGLGAITGLGAQFLLLKSSIQEAAATLQPFYDALIGSNDRLNQELIKSQVSIANSSRLFNSFGEEILDVGDKIDVTRGRLKTALVQIQRDTRELNGVTTQEVNQIFNAVLTEGANVLASQGGDVINEATRLAKGLTAALGTFGLPTSQINQEFRALISGDLNNPDARLIKSLNIKPEDFRKAEQAGKLVDFILERTEAAEAAQKKITETSVSGAISNIQSVFEDNLRVVGEPLLEPFVATLNQFYKLLADNEAEIAAFAKEFGQDLAALFSQIGEIAGRLANNLGPGLIEFTKIVGTTASLVVEGFTKIGGVINATTEQYDRLVNFLSNGIPGISGLVDSLTPITSQFFRVNENIGIFRESIAKLNGDFQDSQSALDSYSQQVEQIISVNTRLVQELRNLENDNVDDKIQKDRIEALKRRIAIQGEAIAKTKEEIEQTNVFFSQEGQRKGLIDDLQTQLKLSESIATVDIQPLKLTEYKGTVEELTKSLERNLQTLKDNGRGQITVYNQAIDKASELNQTLFELGEIDLSSAADNLLKIINNPATEPERRVKVQKQLLSLYDSEIQKIARVSEVTLKQSELAEATGNIGSAQAKINQLLVQRQNISKEIDILQSKLEVALSTNNTRVAEELRNKIAALGIEFKKLAVEVEAVKLDDAIEKANQAFDRANRTITQNNLRREIALQTSLEAQFQSISEFGLAEIQQQQKTNQEQLAEARRQLARLNALSAEGLSRSKQRELKEQQDEAAIEVLRLTRESANITNQLGNQRRQIITESFQVEKQLREQELTQVEADLVRRERLERDSATKIAEDRAEIRLRQVKDELTAQRDLINQLQALEPETAQDQLKNQEALRDARIEAAKLELQLVNALGDREDARIARVNLALDQQLQKYQLIGERRRSDIEIETSLLEAQSKSIENVAAIDQARSNLIQSQIALSKQAVQFRQQELALGQELVASYKEAGVFEQRLIRERLSSLGISATSGRAGVDLAKQELEAKEKQFEVAKLELAETQRQQKEELQNRQQLKKIQAEIQLAQAKANLENAKFKKSELQVELAKAATIKDADERARVTNALNNALGIQEAQIGLAERQVELAQEYADTLQSTNKLEQRSLANSQEADRRSLIQQRSAETFQAKRRIAQAEDAFRKQQSQDRQQVDSATNFGSFSNFLTPPKVQTAPNLTGNLAIPTQNITNNYSAPLVNQSVSRALGV